MSDTPQTDPGRTPGSAEGEPNPADQSKSPPSPRTPGQAEGADTSPR